MLAEAQMSAWPLAKLADWFQRQSQRSDIPLAEQVMLENVSAWLRNQDPAHASRLRQRDPWIGLSND